MAMGMSYTEFWEGPAHLAVTYREAHKLRRELDNEQAWIQGIYFYDAIAVCLANAFGKRGAKKQEYMGKPIDIFPLSEREKKRREREEMEKMQEALKAMARKQRNSKPKDDVNG